MWEVILTILGPIVGYLAKKLVDSFIARDQNAAEMDQKLDQLRVFQDAALEVVRIVELELTGGIKDSNGTLTAGQAAAAKHKALAALQEKYDTKGLLDLQKLFNCNLEELDKLFDLQIEAAVHENKTGKRQVIEKPSFKEDPFRPGYLKHVREEKRNEILMKRLLK